MSIAEMNCMETSWERDQVINLLQTQIQKRWII